MTRRMIGELYTARVPSSPAPIGPYERRMAAVRRWDPRPPARPMHVGSIIPDGEESRLHFHAHPRGTGDLSEAVRSRDAPRADRARRDGYARVKAEIAGPAGGPVDAVRYQADKGVWI